MNLQKATPQADKPPKFIGWLSTDSEEISRRQWRGKTENAQIQIIDDQHWPHCDYRVESGSGSQYTVEWRSAAERNNSCDCADFSMNRLGTCKHIESVNAFLSADRTVNHHKSKNARAEVFIDESDSRKIKFTRPEDGMCLPADMEEKIISCLKQLNRGSDKSLAMLNTIAQENSDLIRVSRQLTPWNENKLLERRKVEARNRFETGMVSGENSLDFLKLQLLPYQTDGVLHLAFNERALLADEMGLGKTVQAIAACALLKEQRGVERVLVVSPASLKSEWQEQIEKFSDLPTMAVFGSPAQRLRAYGAQTFFTLCNYEQIIHDLEKIMELFQPQVVILDEAQRIKNWRTKTATAIKKLKSRYAFVLTGTPLENRIDEVYSIVQFLNPDLLGPLFQFNRDFYQLDERGKPIGYQNLDELNRRISTVMLRRSKHEVEKELPPRTDNTYFVPMTDDQMDFYLDYKATVARIASKGKSRPLSPDEFKRLQQCLACMRMVCDTPQILDKEKRYDCPKLDEIGKLFPELLEDPQRKIIVFSEWIGMLELVREFAAQSGWEFAWHTGSVPQQRRRAEIKRFREDPHCRLFLSSESGGVGLNLQSADTVVNLDQPWNPAKLEQRISRAWRKHQTRPVTVINIVSENTIEHRMLGLLNSKRMLADGVLDGKGDLEKIKLPSSRAGFLEKLSEVLHEDSPKTIEKKQPKSPLDKLVDLLKEKCGATLKNIFAGESESVLVVMDIAPDQVLDQESLLQRLSEFSLNVIDLPTYQSMQRLAQTGMMSLPTTNMQEIFPSAQAPQSDTNKHMEQALKLIERAEHKLKAVQLLEAAGFTEEALTPAKDSACIAITALATLRQQPQPQSAEDAAELLTGEEIHTDTPHKVVSLLLDSDFDGEAADVVNKTIVWVRNLLARS